MTKLLPRPDVSGLDPNDAARRDYTSETDWFPIFRSGNYPQGKFSPDQIDEIVTEFTMHGRRSPIVNDHLTKEDFAAGSKPGSSLGNVIALRAVDSPNPLYPGERELQARAKVGFYAAYASREGARRNVSAGCAKVKSVKDQVVRWALHHLALLGAAPPGVMGLPEVIFSEEMSLDEGAEILRFSTDAGIPVPATESTGPTNQENRVHTIAFTEHQALLQARESELKLEHTGEVASFKEQIQELTGQVALFKAEAEKASAEVTAAKAEVETVKADAAVKVEEAKQAGAKEGEAKGLEHAHRMYEEQRTKDSLVAFCDKLHAEGKLTEAEFKGVPAVDGKPAELPMAEALFTMPESTRARFSALLEARPGIKVPLERPASVREPSTGGLTADAAFQERVNIRCTAILKSNPSLNFNQAWSQAETEMKEV